MKILTVELLIHYYKLKVICGTDYVTHLRTDFHVTYTFPGSVLLARALIFWDPYAFSRHAVVG